MPEEDPSKGLEFSPTPAPVLTSEPTGANGNLLAHHNSLLDQEVKKALEAKIEATELLVLPRPGDYASVEVKKVISESLAASGFDETKTSIGLPTQRNEVTEEVDLSFNVVGMARASGSPADEVADGIAGQLTGQPYIAKAATVGPFVNIEYDYDRFAPRVIGEVEDLGELYGHFRDGEPQVVIVDFSSPNVAKNMTIAHLRSTIIGQSLVKLQEASGNVAFGINHIGDWGTQFGNIIYEYRKELEEKGDKFLAELHEDPTATLMRIYRNFNKRDEDDPAIAQAQEIFLRLEQGDPELVELWSQFREWSLRDFGPSYDTLRVNFDAIQGESFYEDRMDDAVKEAIKKGVLEVNEDGAVVLPAQPLTDPTTKATNDRVMLDAEGNPRDEIIVKPSGGTVYLTRDLAAIRYRGQELGADKILYVIGKEQKKHCLELFAMADQLGHIALGDAEHISFGHLNVDGRKMKSRSGEITLLKEAVDEAIEAASDIIRARKLDSGNTSELTEEETEVARQVGISALIFSDLKQSREKDVEFDADLAEKVEAGNSTYIQYTNSRLNSILEKVGEPSEAIEVPKELSKTEKAIVARMALFPEIVQEASIRNAPHKVASYITEFCQAVSLFYHDQPIGTAPEKQKNFRLHLVKSARQVIRNASDLLHIELPERM